MYNIASVPNHSTEGNQIQGKFIIVTESTSFASNPTHLTTVTNDIKGNEISASMEMYKEICFIYKIN